jgi:hypothetical protein
MNNATIEKRFDDVNERLSQMTRAQAQFTWVLRSLRIEPPVKVPVPSTSVTPTRRMLRVTPPLAPTRPTKRNYDYFAELERSLAALQTGGSPHGSSAGAQPPL